MDILVVSKQTVGAKNRTPCYMLVKHGPLFQVHNPTQQYECTKRLVIISSSENGKTSDDIGLHVLLHGLDTINSCRGGSDHFYYHVFSRRRWIAGWKEPIYINAYSFSAKCAFRAV